jgi:hypothetical protein
LDWYFAKHFSSHLLLERGNMGLQPSKIVKRAKGVQPVGINGVLRVLNEWKLWFLLLHDDVACQIERMFVGIIRQNSIERKRWGS